MANLYFLLLSIFQVGREGGREGGRECQNLIICVSLMFKEFLRKPLLAIHPLFPLSLPSNSACRRSATPRGCPPSFPLSASSLTCHSPLPSSLPPSLPQCVPQISNTYGVPTILLPLSFVIFVDAVFAALEVGSREGGKEGGQSVVAHICIY